MQHLFEELIGCHAVMHDVLQVLHPGEMLDPSRKPTWFSCPHGNRLRAPSTNKPLCPPGQYLDPQ